MRAMAQWKTPISDEATDPERTVVEPSTPMTVLFNNQLVCVTIADEPIGARRDGVCNCGGCQGGRKPDSAADYF
jgi:hypothetical protein